MDTNLPGHDGPEYLGDGPAAPAPTDEPAGRGRRTAALAATGVAVLAVVGIGGWGVARFLSGGDDPASALPASTAAYLSIDLDPSAGQKIEAIRTLKKFPGIADHLDLGVRDDLRRYVFEKAVTSADCKGFDYDADVKPWIGERLAVAAVPDGDGAVPVVAVQASDEDAARAAVAELNQCAAGSEDAGVAFVDGYLLVSDSQKHADLVARQAAQGSLADDPGFTTWMDRAGDPGVVTGYASKDAPALLGKLAGRQMAGPMAGPIPGMGGLLGSPRSGDRMREVSKSFEGAAMVVRFGGGSVETEVVTKGMPQSLGAAKAPSVASLPGSTAVALSVGLRDGWLKDYLGTLDGIVGGGLDDAMKQGEAATGLKLPEDVETLLGDGVTLSVDGSIDPKKLAASPDPSTVPVALRISGDPARITSVVDKLKAAAGPQADVVTVRSGDGVVVLGLSPSYVDRVMSEGGLGSVQAFGDVVPHAGDAASLLYVDFDAGDWATRLGDLVSGDDPDVRANLAPLHALGVSGWVDGDGVSHGLLRLTTD